MSTQLNADEVFGIGVEIETNGRAFYLAAAEAATAPGQKELLIRLADWELGHMKLFESLRARLSASAKVETVYDPAGEIGLYLKGAADSHVFVRTLDVAALARKCASALEVLQVAMTFEKDSVVYYTAMKKVVSVNLGRNDIDRLIDEEMKHIAILDREMRALAQ